jgi:cell division protein FtsQ
MQARLTKFAHAYQSTLSQLNVNVLYADLRYSNGFAVRRPVNVSYKPMLDKTLDKDLTGITKPASKPVKPIKPVLVPVEKPVKEDA